MPAQVVAKPDATLAEHRAAWIANGHWPVSLATMGRALQRLGLPLKKDADRPGSCSVARAVWREATTTIPTATLVFLDETSTQVTMTCTRGQARRGPREVDRVPRNHVQNVTCLTAISLAGLHALCVFEGALDGPLFLHWVREWLLPGVPRGTTIVLDNLNVHCNPEVRQAVEVAGCFLLFLPAYSPSFNPIELVFAQLKTHVRGVAARTTETVIEAIGSGMAEITPSHIHGYYRHCDYPLPDLATQPA